MGVICCKRCRNLIKDAFSSKYKHHCPIKWYTMTDKGIEIERKCAEFKLKQKRSKKNGNQ